MIINLLIPQFMTILAIQLFNLNHYNYSFGYLPIPKNPIDSISIDIKSLPFLKISPSIYGFNLFLKVTNAPNEFYFNNEIKIKWCNELDPLKLLTYMPKVICNIES